MPAPHIAIVRLTSLGDVIHALPMAAAIRRHAPDARITWLVEEREQILLHDNPVVDDVVVVPLRRWRRNLTKAVGAFRTLRRELRAARIDALLDVQGLFDRTLLARLLTGAPVRIGFARSHARDAWSPLITNRHVSPPPDVRHIVDQNLRLLQPLGIEAREPAEFPLPTFADGDARAGAWLAAQGIGPQHRLTVLLPSTRRASKFWPAASFREVGRRILSAPETRLLILGGPGEESLLEEVRADLPRERAFVWAPGPIPDLVGVLRRSHMVVGNDTGPLHFAAASGVPSIGLFGPTHGARNGPYGPHCGYVQSPTGRMTDISVDDVWKTVVASGVNRT